MKRIAAVLGALLLCLSCTLPAQARTPKIVDYALYTDIVAKIDGHPLRSYNIAGYTAVVAEDLRGYGFWVIWDPAARTLRISRALKDSELETPERWPDYEPEPLTHRIGTRAKPVYETDIVTYAAGEEAEAFNINGETLVFIDSLSPFGDVVWHPQEREITLTLGDPMEIAFAPLIESVEAWRDFAGAGSGWERYDCPTGSLLVTRMGGTSHGSSTSMLYVRKNGDPVSINSLLPFYVWGIGSYLYPSEIAFDEPGYRLSFLTPVLEMPGWPESGDVRDLGACRCVVDLLTGTLVSLEPLSGELRDWQVSASLPEGAAPGQALSLTVARSGAQVAAAEAVFPAGAMQVSVSAGELRIMHYAALWEDEAFEKTAYHEAYQALRALELPDAATSGEDVANTPEQRAAAAGYFLLTHNGEPVSGDLWWSRGNNHVDLNFTFDRPLGLNDGDTLVLTVGMPR